MSTFLFAETDWEKAKTPGNSFVQLRFGILGYTGIERKIGMFYLLQSQLLLKRRDIRLVSATFRWDLLLVVTGKALARRFGEILRLLR